MKESGRQTLKLPAGELEWVRREISIPRFVYNQVFDDAGTNKHTVRGELSSIICQVYGVDYDAINPSKIKKRRAWSRSITKGKPARARKSKRQARKP